MSNQITQTTANVSTATAATSGAATVGMGFADWVTTNSVLIGVTCTILSLIAAIVFHIINAHLNRKYKKQSYNLDKAELITKWKAQGKSDEEIKDILLLAGVNNAE